jgi:L-ascorbate metabolism protein UlaG (beta-lactamase superfamily)
MLADSNAVSELMAAAAPTAGAVGLWLGQSGFLFRFAGCCIAIDPFLSDHPDRLVPPIAGPDDFKGVDLVIGTHDHLDHIDRNAWREIGKTTARCRFAVPSILLPGLANDIGVSMDRFIGMDDGVSFVDHGIRVTGIAAAHEFFDQDPLTGRYPYLGVVIEGPGATVYHSGDTCLYGGLVERLLQGPGIDLALLPINGRDAQRLRAGIVGNMTYQEAADLAGIVQPRLTLPCHWDMFAFNSEDPEAFVAYMEAKYPHLAARVPEHGEVFVVG